MSGEVRKMKKESEPGLVILGQGRTLFETVKGKIPLKLAKTRSFRNGNVLLWYAPA